MKIAYIAGPYRSKWGLPGRILNILRARKVAKKYWKKGYAVVCPHMNSALMDGVVPDQSFLDGDIEILKHCDVIVMMHSWRWSRGAVDEWEFAKSSNLQVIYD